MSVRLGESCTPEHLRIYAIGDVHGHVALLKELHQRIEADLRSNPVDDYRIVFIGDYIDRGPDSAACVDYLVNQLDANNRMICLKGNHEDKLLRYLKNPLKVADSFFTYGGVQCAESYEVNADGWEDSDERRQQIANELNRNIPESHKLFYEQRPTSVLLGDYFFAHAGIRLGVNLNEQSDEDLMTIRSEFLSHEALFEKIIVHGHTPCYPMDIRDNRINVDTHAYHTGVLSCLVLEDNQYRLIEAKQPTSV